MDLKEIQKMEVELRMDVTNLLNDFIEITGVRRVEMSTTHAYLQAIEEEEEKVYHGIEIKLEG